MDFALSTIAQGPANQDEDSRLIESARRAALHLFPDKEQAIEMIYMSRFRRLMTEKYRLA